MPLYPRSSWVLRYESRFSDPILSKRRDDRPSAGPTSSAICGAPLVGPLLKSPPPIRTLPASRRDLARYPASVGSTEPQQTAPLGAFARPVWAACFGISGFVSCGSCGRGSCAAVPGLPSRFVNDDTRTAAGLLLRAARGRPASRLCLIAFRVQGLDVTRRRAFFPARPNRGAACVRATRRSDRP